MAVDRTVSVKMLSFALGTAVFAVSGSAFAASCVQVSPTLSKLSTDFQEKAAESLFSGSDVAKKVADVVSANTANGASVLRLARVATPEQKQAIGQGIASAALACQTAAPLETFALQSQVIASGDKDVLAAFLKGMSDIQTTFSGAGGGIGGGGGFGPGGAGTSAPSAGAANRRTTPSEPTGGLNSSFGLSTGVSSMATRSSFTVGDTQLRASAPRSP